MDDDLREQGAGQENGRPPSWESDENEGTRLGQPEEARLSSLRRSESNTSTTIVSSVNKSPDSSGSDIEQLAERFKALFDGHSAFYGVYNNVAQEADSNGKKLGTDRRTVRGEVTVDLYERHLQGKSGLGICPIRGDSTARFGAIDIDVYAELSHTALAKIIEQHKLPLVVCRSKSGGAHIYCFTSEPVPATLMVARLKEIAGILGHGSAEIFPKQIRLKPDADSGSWINLCYFNGMLAARYAMRADGDAMDLEQFLQHAVSLQRPLSWFKAPLTVSTELLQGPPCLQQLVQIGFPQGTRNSGLYNLAVYCRKAAPDNWELMLREMNLRFMQPPLAEAEIKTVVGSVKKKSYNYSCSQQPIAAHCNKPVCLTCKFGISDGDNGGLIQELESSIKKEHAIARDDGNLLYVSQGGVYRPTGEDFVKEKVKGHLEKTSNTKRWKPELSRATVEYISADAQRLWQCPPLDTLNCKNGLLDIATRQLRPHDPAFLSPVQINAAYDPSAECPAIDKFVEDTFPEDARHTAYEVAAWLMLPNVSIQQAVLLFGEGSNGKSIYLTLLEDFLGRDNVASIPLHRLESDRFATSGLVGKLANISADLPERALSGTSIFKAIVGNDEIDAERKYLPAFKFRPYSRLVFSTNTLPRSEDPSHGFFRRWLVVPFSKRFSPEDAGYLPPQVLRERLQRELSGLLNRALDKLTTVMEGRFTGAASLSSAWDSFRLTTDPLSVWLDANVVSRPDAYVVKDLIRRRYAQYCEANDKPVLTAEVFTTRLQSLRPGVTPGLHRLDRVMTRCFNGIGWLNDGPVPPEVAQGELGLADGSPRDARPF